MATFKKKRHPLGIQFKIFRGKEGDAYLVLTADAKQAAKDCGCKLDPRRNDTAAMWNNIWLKEK